MRDEDDDLLRAAEELGIDLSGVRATTGESSDEELEGEDSTDAGAPEGEEAPAASADEEVDTGTEEIDLEDLDSEVPSAE
jgi:DNA-directed RNA polymerase subunit beta